MRSDHLTKHVRTHLGISQRSTAASTSSTTTNILPIRAEIVGANLVLQQQPSTITNNTGEDCGIKLELLN